MSIGRNIKKYRIDRGMSRLELAKSVAVSKGYIALIEQGQRQPSVKTLAMIAGCLKVSIEKLKKEG